MFALAGAGWVYVINAVSFAIVGLLILSIRQDFSARAAGEEELSANHHPGHGAMDRPADRFS